MQKNVELWQSLFAAPARLIHKIKSNRYDRVELKKQKKLAYIWHRLNIFKKKYTEIKV